MNAAPYMPYPVRLSPSTRAVKEAAALLGRPGVWSMMLSTFLLCALLGVTPFIAADCLFSFATLLPLSPFAQNVLYGGLISLAALLTTLVVLPVWLGRLRLSVACFTGDEIHPRAIFYYLTHPRRWGRALGTLALFVVLSAVPVGASVGLFLLCYKLYQTVLLTVFVYPIAVLLYAVLLMAAAAAAFGLLLLCGLYLPFLAVAAGNDDLPLRTALALSWRAGRRNFGACAGFLCKSFLRLLLGFLTVGVWQVLWNTHVFLLSYMRLSMALCPKGEPQ